MPTPSDPAPAGPPPLAALTAIAAVGLLGYFATLDVPFVLDDVSEVSGDPRATPVDLGLDALGRAAEGFPLGRWLTRVTFAANHALIGSQPDGYHVVNLVIHLAAAALVWLLAREVLRRVGGLTPAAVDAAALVAALLFVAHPVQVQAVTYVVQRSASLGAALGLLALLLFLRARAAAPPAGRWAWAGAALAAFLAVGAKENLLVLPGLALLLEWLLFPGLAGRLRRHLPLALLGAAALLLAGAAAAWSYRATIGDEQARLGLPVAARLLSQPRVLWHDLSLLAWPLPSRLAADPLFEPSRSLLSPPTTALALLGLAGLVAAAWALRRRVPLASFAVGWFLVALVIEQGVLPIDLTFEQRLYLPSVGPLIALSWGLARLTAGWRLGPWPVAAPLVAALALATHARNEAWRDPLVLLSQPGNQPRVLLTVGALLAERGRLAQAEAAFLQLAEAEPGNVGALFNLAVLARQRGDVAGARALARRAVEVAPDKVETWLLVALEAASAGDRGAAADALGRALRIQPGYPPALDLQRQLGLPAAPSSHGR